MKINSFQEYLRNSALQLYLPLSNGDGQTWTQLKQTESGTVQKALGKLSGFLCPGWLSLQVLCCFIYDLLSLLSLNSSLLTAVPSLHSPPPSLFFPFLSLFFFLLLFPCFNSFAVIWLSVSSWSLQAGDRLKQILRVPWPEWLFSAPPDLQWDQSSSWDLTSVTSLLVT